MDFERGFVPTRMGLPSSTNGGAEMEGEDGAAGVDRGWGSVVVVGGMAGARAPLALQRHRRAEYGGAAIFGEGSERLGATMATPAAGHPGSSMQT
jgi:hypothetical protein